jgi:hypothetical protein
VGVLELSDGKWVWPQGLDHYVRAHKIRLPDEFVTYAASQNFRIPESLPPFDAYSLGVDLKFWAEWCKRNATFAYEPYCLSCNPNARELHDLDKFKSAYITEEEPEHFAWAQILVPAILAACVTLYYLKSRL